MLRTLFSLLIALSFFPARAQLDVYRTYEDVINGTPQSYPKAEFRKWSGQENTTLQFRDGDQQIEVLCADIWGFTYGGATFRVTKDSKYFRRKGSTQVGTPYVVTHKSDVLLYEYGLGLLDAMKKGNRQANVLGMCGAVSRGLNDPMAMVPCTAAHWTDEELYHWLDDNTDLPDLRRRFDERKSLQYAIAPGSFELSWLRGVLAERARELKLNGEGDEGN